MLSCILVFTACSRPADVNAPVVAMGDFSLGHNVVVVDEPTIGPFSRTVTDDEWKESLTSAIANRFDGNDGERLYHLGVKVDGYVLAVPGVPVVFSPKSALIITVTAWDDGAERKLNEEPKQLTVFEGVSGKTLVSSGLTQNKKTQMTTLSHNAARSIQNWLLENPEWFGMTADADASEQAVSTDPTTEAVAEVDATQAGGTVVPLPRPAN